MTIIAGTIIISLTNSNIISKAQNSVGEANLSNIKDAAVLVYADARTELIDNEEFLEGKAMADHIENELISQKLIDKNNTIIFNNEGGIEKTVVGSSEDFSFIPSIGQINHFENHMPETTTIPNVIDGYKVKSIIEIDPAHGGIASNVQTLDIQYGITSIGDSAFVSVPNLTKVTIPNSVTYIGFYAFKYCSKLTSITIPNSVSFIGNTAFENCDALTTINIKKPKNSIAGSPWGAPNNPTINWLDN